MNTLKEDKILKKKILVFPFNLLSHYLRCLALANRYNSQEYEIFFLHSDQYAKFIDQDGYQTFSAKQFDSAYAMRCTEKFNFDWLNPGDIEIVFNDQVRAINELKSDIVIGDVAPALKMAAEFCGVQYIALMNGYMTKHYVLTRKLSRTHYAYKALKLFPDVISGRITRFAERRAFKKVHKPFKTLRRKYGLGIVSDYLQEMEGDHNLICDLPELFPQINLPHNYEFIKPLLYESVKENQHFPNLDNGRSVICVCMGSTGNWEALGFLNDPYFAKYNFITGGDFQNILSAPHIQAFDFLNLDQALGRSRLLICHGGNGTIYFGLKHGVYMLCLTSHFEQEWNVQALERIGYGKSANEFAPTTWATEIARGLEKQLPVFYENDHYVTDQL